MRSAGVPSTERGGRCKRIPSPVWTSGVCVCVCVCVFPLPHDSVGSEIIRTRTF